MGGYAGTTALLLYLTLSAARRNARTNVCKWCNYSQPSCEGGTCLTNCSLSSYCETSEEICVTLWKQDNVSVQVITLCHHPLLPLENIMVPSYNSTRCVMQPVPSQTGRMYICGCVYEQECNDKLIFYDPNGNWIRKVFDGKHKLRGKSGSRAFSPSWSGFMLGGMWSSWRWLVRILVASTDYSLLHSREAVPVATISLLPPLLLAITVTVLFYLYRTQRLRRRSKSWPEKPEDYSYRLSSSLASSTQCDLSAACANRFNHNTELLPIELEQRVGKGRFAEVWRAKLKHTESGQGETVAVKIFPFQEYLSWRNEICIFTDANVKHENVLQFITAEERSNGLHKEYWIITAYHARGSLKDYLANHVLSWETFLKMAGSIVRGVAYMHSEYTPCGAPKIAIAHRDIKSTNILVKSETECTLCDFGITLRLDPALTVDAFANSGQAGTARYMAPEVLESRVNLEDLESFKQMDVYSLALVLWEMASRCEAIGEVKNYELPFGSMMQEEPCVETIRDVVLHGKGRPDIPDTWRRHPGMDVLCDTITECWDHDPEARLTAPCVAERFNLLEQMDCDCVSIGSSAVYYVSQ